MRTRGVETGQLFSFSILASPTVVFEIWSLGVLDGLGEVEAQAADGFYAIGRGRELGFMDCHDQSISEWNVLNIGTDFRVIDWSIVLVLTDAYVG
jgi:hypothetical protein